MDLKEIDVNTRNWVDLAQNRDYESACECSIEPPGPISHGVSYIVLLGECAGSSWADIMKSVSWDGFCSARLRQRSVKNCQLSRISVLAIIIIIIHSFILR